MCAFFLTIVLLLSTPVTAEPAEINFSGRELSGTVVEEFDILPLNSDLFYMTANEVSGLLTTYNSNKYFTKASLDCDNVYFSGKFTHSVSSAALNGIRAGLCTYNSSTGLFDAKFYMTFKSGVAMMSEYFSKDEMESNTRYYGFVKNLYTTGTISGHLYVGPAEKR